MEALLQEAGGHHLSKLEEPNLDLFVLIERWRANQLAAQAKKIVHSVVLVCPVGPGSAERHNPIGAIAGLLCFWACTRLKRRFKYDDSLDVFGVHGVGGITGVLLTGVFATASVGGTPGLLEGNPYLVLTQLYGVVVTLVWSAGITFALLKLVGLFVPLRVSLQQELEGLDISQHGEALQ